jgi:pimeloyl-ACP methyl ester carboxylesterase
MGVGADTQGPELLVEERKVDVLGNELQVRSLTRPGAHPARAPVASLVFLHDALGCIELWGNFPERLARRTGLNALVYDRQGHGRSAPFSRRRTRDYLHEEALQVLPALLARCGIREHILVGHSDGGSIALIAASRLDAGALGAITEAAYVFVEEATLEGVREGVRAYETTNVREKLARYHGDKVEALHRAWSETWLSPGFRDWNIEDRLPSIRCPVLAIQGAEDQYGTAAQVHAIVRQVSGPSRASIIPGCGHTPHRQATQRVEDEMAAFVQPLAGAAAG